MLANYHKEKDSIGNHCPTHFALDLEIFKEDLQRYG
jgi:hypothetical protein